MRGANQTLSVRRGRGALATRGTRRESIRGGSAATSMSPHGPASGNGTAPDKVRIVLVKALHTGQLDESLPARRRGTRREPVAGDSMAASMPPTVLQALRTPHQKRSSAALVKDIRAMCAARWRTRARQQRRRSAAPTTDPSVGQSLPGTTPITVWQSPSAAVDASHRLTHRGGILCACSSPSAA